MATCGFVEVLVIRVFAHFRRKGMEEAKLCCVKVLITTKYLSRLVSKANRLAPAEATS